MAGNAPDLSGVRFGRLVAMQRLESDKRGNAKWLCKCDCGAEKAILAQSLRKGATISCGCYNREVVSQATYRHGSRSHRAYGSWDAMIQRCTNPNSEKWPMYGGRGIMVCERWLSFENFLSDMGERPPGMTIDRIDNDAGYEPWNCRWATQKTQGSNRRNNRMVVRCGERLTASDASRAIGGSRSLVSHRLTAGWSESEAVSIPAKRK